MAVSFGNESYFLVGKQTAPRVIAPYASFSDKQYQFTSGAPVVSGEYTTPEANRGTFAPVAPVLGQLSTEGSITVPQDIDGLGLLLELVMLDAPDSTQILATPYTLFASAAFTNDTAITTFVTNMQPNEHIPTLQDGCLLYTSPSPRD